MGVIKDEGEDGSHVGGGQHALRMLSAQWEAGFRSVEDGSHVGGGQPATEAAGDRRFWS